MSDLVKNIPTITAFDVAYYIAQYAATTKTPLMLWGAAGVGKSASVAAAAKALGTGFVDYRLTYHQPEDLGGIPYVDERKVKTAMPDLIRLIEEEREKNKAAGGDGRVVVFFDELSSAIPEVAVAAYQIMHDRRIGEYSIGDDDILVAAGNRQGDGGIVNDMPTPLANRMSHVNVVADAEQWVNWAISADVHPFVIGYINQNLETSLCPKNPDNALTAYPTPRSWYNVSKVLKQKQTVKPDQFSDIGVYADGFDFSRMQRNAIEGLIGKVEATKFAGFLEFGAKLPNVADVCNGTVSPDFKYDDNTNRKVLHYLTSINVILHIFACRKSDGNNSITVAKASEYFINFVKFAMAHKIDPDVVFPATRRLFQTFTNSEKIVDFNKILKSKEVTKYGIVQKHTQYRELVKKYSTEE